MQQEAALQALRNEVAELEEQTRVRAAGSDLAGPETRSEVDLIIPVEHIHFDVPARKELGSGSFSRVYRSKEGGFFGETVAVKLLTASGPARVGHVPRAAGMNMSCGGGAAWVK